MYTSFGGHVLEYFIHIYHYAIDDEKNTYYFTKVSHPLKH